MEKQLSLMNYLGGIGIAWVMLNGSLGSCRRTSEPPGVSHLWTATQEQRDNRQPCSLATVQPHANMGSGLMEYVVRTRILRDR